MKSEDRDQKAEQLRYVLDGIHSWNRSVDGKAGFIAAFASLALGWTVDDASVLVLATSVFWVLIAAFLLCGGVVLAAAAVFPVVSLKDKPWSALFFQDIAKKFGSDIQLDQAVNQYVELLGNGHEKSLAEQVLANSIVARRKFALIKAALFVTLCGVLLSMVLHLFSAVAVQSELEGSSDLNALSTLRTLI